MASQARSLTQRPPLSPGEVFRLIVMSAIVGAGMGLFGFFMTMIFGAEFAGWAKEAKQRSA